MWRPITFRLALIFALTALCATVFGQERAASPPVYQLIVHPSNPETSADRKFVEDAFLKKISTWPNGEVIRPADLAPDSTARRAFTREVLRRSVDEVKRYWQQRIFSGVDVPPPEFGSDDEVVAYVRKHEGGIGYVSGVANLNGCKTIAVR